VKLRQSVQSFVQNPENLTITNAPVQIGRDMVRVPELEITGTNLQFPNQIEAKSTRLVIRDVKVNLKGKEKTVTHVGEGSFDGARLLRKR